MKINGYEEYMTTGEVAEFFGRGVWIIKNNRLWKKALTVVYHPKLNYRLYKKEDIYDLFVRCLGGLVKPKDYESSKKYLLTILKDQRDRHLGAYGPESMVNLKIKLLEENRESFK